MYMLLEPKQPPLGRAVTKRVQGAASWVLAFAGAALGEAGPRPSNGLI